MPPNVRASSEGAGRDGVRMRRRGSKSRRAPRAAWVEGVSRARVGLEPNLSRLDCSELWDKSYDVSWWTIHVILIVCKSALATNSWHSRVHYSYMEVLSLHEAVMLKPHSAKRRSEHNIASTLTTLTKSPNTRDRAQTIKHIGFPRHPSSPCLTPQPQSTTTLLSTTIQINYSRPCRVHRSVGIQSIERQNAQADRERFLEPDSTRDGASSEDKRSEEGELDAVGLVVLDANST